MTFQALAIESKTSFEMSSLLLNSISYAFFSTSSSISCILRSQDYSISLKIKELERFSCGICKPQLLCQLNYTVEWLHLQWQWRTSSSPLTPLPSVILDSTYRALYELHWTGFTLVKVTAQPIRTDGVTANTQITSKWRCWQTLLMRTVFSDLLMTFDNIALPDCKD